MVCRISRAMLAGLAVLALSACEGIGEFASTVGEAAKATDTLLHETAGALTKVDDVTGRRSLNLDTRQRDYERGSSTFAAVLSDPAKVSAQPGARPLPATATKAGSSMGKFAEREGCIWQMATFMPATGISVLAGYRVVECISAGTAPAISGSSGTVVSTAGAHTGGKTAGASPATGERASRLRRVASGIRQPGAAKAGTETAFAARSETTTC